MSTLSPYCATSRSTLLRAGNCCRVLEMRTWTALQFSLPTRCKLHWSDRLVLSRRYHSYTGEGLPDLPTCILSVTSSTWLCRQFLRSHLQRRWQPWRRFTKTVPDCLCQPSGLWRLASKSSRVHEPNLNCNLALLCNKTKAHPTSFNPCISWRAVWPCTNWLHQCG